MILQINDLTDWRYVRHHKQAQIEKGVIIEKTNRIDYYYIVGYQLMIKHKSEYKYKTLFKGPYGIVQTWTNITFTLRMGEVTARINTLQIKPCHNPNIE